MTLKPDSIPDLTELVQKLENLKKLRVKLETERDIIQKRKTKLLEKLKLVNIPENLDEYISNLTKTLTSDLAKIVIPEDLENELRNFRDSSDK